MEGAHLSDEVPIINKDSSRFGHASSNEDGDALAHSVINISD